MKKRTILVGALLVAGIVSAGYYSFFISPGPTGDTVADEVFGWKFPITKFPLTGANGELAYSTIRDPGGVPQGLPVRLKIPTIGVNTAIEDALITPDGRMDVPAGSKNVAWFSLGPTPGKIGSAVIGGHFGIRDGVPFVFYNLDKITVGDKIYIEDDKDDTITFEVKMIKLFDRDADATTVFTSSDGKAHLNLITCEGIWNRVDGSYPQRRVVFADVVSTTADAPIIPIPPAAPTKAQDVALFYRTLSIGSTGSDVVALQLFLEEKELFTLPPRVTYGYFGTITSSAIRKYQISAGLAPDGVFGSSTRAKILAELGGDTGLPNTAGTESGPVVSTTVPEATTSLPIDSPPTPDQPVTSLLESLFGTLRDALITLALLFGVIFLAFKIIRR